MPKKKHWRRWLMILLVSLFIWGNSLIPATLSSEESGRLVALLAPLLTKLNLSPSLWQWLVRKGAHMTEFALLAMAWTWTLCWEKISVKRIGGAAALCMVSALLDETIQIFTPGRSSQVSDVWVDLLGAAIGMTLMMTAILLTDRRK